jgi:hypothetical protein
MLGYCAQPRHSDMKSIWDGGRRYGEDFEDGDSKYDAQDEVSEGSQLIERTHGERDKPGSLYVSCPVTCSPIVHMAQ